MARASKAVAAKPAPEPEEAPLAKLLDKEPSEVHNRFVDYIADEVGYDCDPKTVQLVISQWQKFQKTPEQQEYTKAKKEAAAAAREERDAARAEAPAEAPKRGRRSASKAVDVEDEEETPKPAPRGRRGAATAAPAKRTTTRRRAASAPADDELD